MLELGKHLKGQSARTRNLLRIGFSVLLKGEFFDNKMRVKNLARLSLVIVLSTLFGA